MEKILLALDAHNVNTPTLDFACYIARLTKSKLTGVFLEDLYQDDIDGKPRMESSTVGDDARLDVVRANIHRFRESCACRETTSLVHRDRGIPLSQVTAESRFADLIIVDPVTSFSRSDRSNPSRFVKDVLLDAECPVLIAPYSFDDVEQIIFAYDGSASSVYAIKQFTHLFPGLCTKKAVVVSVRNEETTAIEQQFKMKEWLKSHYLNIEFVLLKGDPHDELFGYLLEKQNIMVVMGAYGRSILSRFFKPSHARLIIKTLNLPVFIAHQ